MANPQRGGYPEVTNPARRLEGLSDGSLMGALAGLERRGVGARQH
jgi:hypothetical protein